MNCSRIWQPGERQKNDMNIRKLRTDTYIFLVLFIGIMASCVSKKEYQKTVFELNATQGKLDSSLALQASLKRQLNEMAIASEMQRKEDLQDRQNAEFRVYINALKSADRQLTAVQLAKLAEIDTANRAMYYDSLAFYHFFYLPDARSTDPFSAANFYVNKGLALNPNNYFLQEIQMRLFMNEATDTAFTKQLRELYAKTSDYTFLYMLVTVDFAVNNNVNRTQKEIDAILKRTEIGIKSVRIVDVPNKINETVPAIAAFYYLKAATSSDREKMVRNLEIALKYAPNFYTAKMTLYQIKNQQGTPQGYR